MDKRIKIISCWLSLLAGLLVWTGCSEQEIENKLTTQEQQIDRYITTQAERYRIVRRNGSNRIILTEGMDEQGTLLPDSLQYGDSVRFYYACYLFSNGPSTLYATNHQATAQAKGFQVTDPDFSIEAWLYKKGVWISGVDNGFYGVRTGEHGYIIFSAKYGFGDEPMYNIPKLSPLLYEYWIEEVKPN